MDDTRSLLGGLLADFDFLALDQRLANPNVFRLFQMEYVEAKHSTFLAWLLDPNAGHGLEDRFLKRFLAAALLSPPPENGDDAPPLSPIPYEAVCQRLLSWDTMDALSADLRDTNVSTNLRRKADGGAIDIALWNDSYNIAVYIQNRIAPAHVWKVRRGPARPPRPHESEHYLLDLYAQWGKQEAGAYDVLPVFLALGDMEPSEKRCFHRVDYSWMPGFLDVMIPQVTPAAAPLISGFCDRLRLEMPETLEPDLHERLVSLTKRYGRVVTRMADHVHRCTGCEDDDVTVAFHDIYRRHRATVDFLSGFVDSLPDERTAQAAELVTRGLDRDKFVLDIGPASLSVRPKPPKGTEAGHMVEIYFGLHSESLSVILYVDQASGSLDCIFQEAARIGKTQGIEIDLPDKLTRNLVFVEKVYDNLDLATAVSDLLELTSFIATLCDACREPTNH